MKPASLSVQQIASENLQREQEQAPRRIIRGENLTALRELHGASVELIYIDPPFNTGMTQRRKRVRTVSDVDGDRVGFQMLLSADSPFVATVAQDVPHIGELAGQTIEEALAGKKDFPGLMFTDAYVATRANGIAAAERRWGKDVWKAIEMDPKEIATRFPQTESVLVVRPTLP